MAAAEFVINTDWSRDDFVAWAYALRGAFGDAGKAIWIRFAAQSVKATNPATAEKVWRTPPRLSATAICARAPAPSSRSRRRRDGPRHRRRGCRHISQGSSRRHQMLLPEPMVIPGLEQVGKSANEAQPIELFSDSDRAALARFPIPGVGGMRPELFDPNHPVPHQRP